VSDPQSTAALFAGGNPAVQATYERLLEALREIGPFREEPKKTSIHLVRTTGFAGVHPRKHWLILNLRTASRFRARASPSSSRSPRIATIMRLSSSGPSMSTMRSSAGCATPMRSGPEELPIRSFRSGSHGRRDAVPGIAGDDRRRRAD